MSKNNIGDSDKLWDEILKAIVERMPEQLLPLIKDVFNISYPNGVSIRLLPTESIIQHNTDPRKLKSIYSDIAIIIDNKDIYHIESQITNDKSMAIRMIKYDFNLAMSASFSYENTNEYVLEFPKSVVIYPAPNNKIPDSLTCHLIFPDGSTHDYKVPTLKIQQYSLKEIREKHLTLFLPFKLLQFRPRLKSKKSPVTEAELTDFINDIILILREEVVNHRITTAQYEDYVDLIDKSAYRVFDKYSDLQERVISMTKSLITLPSERYEQYEAQLAEKDAVISSTYQKLAGTEQKLAGTEQKLAGTEQELLDAQEEIAKLKKLLAEASKK